MKIKTIWDKLTWADRFDKEVNAAIEEGWLLTKREMLPGGPLTPDDYRPCMLYAELVLPDPPAEPAAPDLFVCAEVIRQECARHTSCTSCPLQDVCECLHPAEWKAAPGHD